MSQSLDMPSLPSIDAQDLMARLAAAPSPLPVIKPLLKRIQEESHAYFRATFDADTLVPHRAKLMDTIMQCLDRKSVV